MTSWWQNGYRTESCRDCCEPGCGQGCSRAGGSSTWRPARPRARRSSRHWRISRCIASTGRGSEPATTRQWWSDTPMTSGSSAPLDPGPNRTREQPLGVLAPLGLQLKPSDAAGTISELATRRGSFAHRFLRPRAPRHPGQRQARTVRPELGHHLQRDLVPTLGRLHPRRTRALRAYACRGDEQRR
jgi:hypothetical protein